LVPLPTVLVLKKWIWFLSGFEEEEDVGRKKAQTITKQGFKAFVRVEVHTLGIVTSLKICNHFYLNLHSI